MSQFTAEKVEIKVGNSDTKIVVENDGNISIQTPEGNISIQNSSGGVQIGSVDDDVSIYADNGDVIIGGETDLHLTGGNITQLQGGATRVYSNPYKVDIQSFANDIYMKPHSTKKVEVDGALQVNGTLTIGGNTYARARYPNWVLVERKTLSTASETTFSNLDGNTDLAYFFRYSLSVPQTAVRDILITPNGNITTNQYVASHWVGYNGTAYEHGGGMGTNSGAYGLVLARGAHPTVFNPLYFEGETLLYPKTGRARRNCISNGMVWDSDPTIQYSIHSHSVWNEASTNITSLKVAPTGNTMTGFIELYKWKDGVTEI